MGYSAQMLEDSGTRNTPLGYGETIQNVTMLEQWVNVRTPLRFPLVQLIVCIVDRLSWLKARAQYYRWTEELSILSGEMEWIVRYFHYEYSRWDKLLQGAQSMGETGHAAFAAKQRAMWREFGTKAQVAFLDVNQKFECIFS